MLARQVTMTCRNAYYNQTGTCPALLSAHCCNHLKSKPSFTDVQDRDTEVADQIWTVHNEDVLQLCALPRSSLQIECLIIRQL